ncbi:putative uncharacterized protein C8orf44 [Plecturocebus cupreus]
MPVIPALWKAELLRRLRQENCFSLGGRGCALWEAKAGGLPELRSSKPAWATWQNLISTKNTKISQTWWHTPIVPLTQEAEGLALPPQLQCSGATSVHCNLHLLGSSDSRASASQGPKANENHHCLSGLLEQFKTNMSSGHSFILLDMTCTHPITSNQYLLSAYAML